MKFRLLLIALLVGGAPAMAGPWDDYPYGGPHDSAPTGRQTTPGGNIVWASPPSLPQATTGTTAGMSVNPMPVVSDGFSLGFGGQGHSLYTGTYAFNMPAGILPPVATSSLVGLNVVEESAFNSEGVFFNPDQSHYQQQQQEYMDNSEYYQN